MEATNKYHHPLWPTTAVAFQDELFLYPPQQETTTTNQHIPFIFYNTTVFTDGKTHRIRPDNGDPIMQTQNDLAIGLILLCFALLAWIRYNFPRRLNQILKAAFEIRYITQLQREGNIFSEQISLVLSVIFLIAFPLLGYALSIYTGFFRDNNDYMAIILAGLAMLNGLMWLLKAWLNRILAHLFRTKDATRFYLLNNLVFNITIGLTSLIFLPFIFFSEWDLLLYPTAGIIAFLLLYKVTRGLVVSFGMIRYPAPYLILYVIAIEILPLFLLGKLLFDWATISL